LLCVQFIEYDHKKGSDCFIDCAQGQPLYLISLHTQYKTLYFLLLNLAIFKLMIKSITRFLAQNCLY